MKVSFICPVRDKAPYVEKTVRSILAQTYSPMEIVLSDQGSTDGSLKIIRRLAANYDGPNRVRVLSCPDTSRKGMIGLNNHLNFLDTQIEGDVVIMCSADDLNHPERAAHTVQAFEAFNPSYVNTGVVYARDDGEVTGMTDFPDRGSRWLGVRETIEHGIGSNGSSAWARDLYQKHAPLRGCEQQDLILPMMALFERGIYFVDIPLHVYIMHPSLDNTGIMGQLEAAKDDAVLNNQLAEINNFMHVFNWTAVLGRWQSDPEITAKVTAADVSEMLMQKMSGAAFMWAQVRHDLIVHKIAPRDMRI